MTKLKLKILIYIFGLFLLPTYVFAGTILDAYKHAWSNNIGYINLENITVDDNGLYGKAWSANAGWINFNPSIGGVLNDGRGNLSGSAWGANLGWINFDNVSIDGSTGKFSGQASGPLAGVITFDCRNCDVRTNWRKVVLASSGSLIGSYPLSRATTSEVQKNIQIENEQPGIYIAETIFGNIKIDIMANSLLEKAYLFVDIESSGVSSKDKLIDNLTLINNTIYNIKIVDKNGSNIKNFDSPINITLPLPDNLERSRDLNVYWLDEKNNKWILIKNTVFSERKVVFKINNLGKFSIYQNNNYNDKNSIELIEQIKLDKIDNIYSSPKNSALKNGEELLIVKEPPLVDSDLTDTKSIKLIKQSIFLRLSIILLLLMSLYILRIKNIFNK